MKTKPKAEGSAKWKSHFLAGLVEVLMGQIQMQSSYGAVSVLPDMFQTSVPWRRGISSCVCQRKLLSAIKHLKTLVLCVILVPAKQHAPFADPLYISWEAVPPEAASSCPFMWLHLDVDAQDNKLQSIF